MGERPDTPTDAHDPAPVALPETLLGWLLKAGINRHRAAQYIEHGWVWCDGHPLPPGTLYLPQGYGRIYINPPRSM